MYFKNSTHQYIINGRNYKSFSSIIKLVYPDKDWDEIAEKYAKKHKLKKEDVKKAWFEEGRQSREKGTMFHGLKEDEDRSRTDIPVFFEDTVDDIKKIKPLEELEDGVHVEVALYNNEYQACGTADRIFIETIDGVRYVDIDDYKSSKEIKTESYCNPKTGKYDCLKAPLNHVMDCKFMEYSIQLSMYAFFLEKYGYTPRKLTLIHLVNQELTPALKKKVSPKYVIDFEGKQYCVSEEVCYNVTYMKKEVKALLQLHKIKFKQYGNA